MPAISASKLLIVDDEATQMEALRNTLAEEGYLTVGFTSAHEALAALREQEFDLVLTDLMMPGMDGIAFLRDALETDPNLVGILMTGHGTIDSAVAAMKVGALDYILKPFKLREVRPVLSRALAMRQLRVENIQLRETLAIYELSVTIASAGGFGAILEKLADAAFTESDHGEVSILIRTDDSREMTVAAVRGDDIERLAGRRIPIGGAVEAWCARSHEAFAGSSGDTTPAHEHPFREFTSGIALPMLAGGELVGVLNFASSHRHRAVTLGQIKTLNILVSSAASALVRQRLLEQLEDRVKERTAQLQEKNSQMEEELNMARELQMAMLPRRFPCVPRDAPPAQSALRFHSVYRPAGSVSGDFFDVFPLEDNSVGVFIGDVMGHDVRAALITAMMRALVQELSASLADPGALLAELNRHLRAILNEAETVMFATASYLVLNLENSRLLYANAGHPAPIHLQRARGQATPIFHNGDSGPALGLFDGIGYKTCNSSLSAGDCILLFTDGLFEVEAADERLFGEKRLRDSVSQQINLPAEELLRSLLFEAHEFSGEEKFADDVCLVAVEVTTMRPSPVVS